MSAESQRFNVGRNEAFWALGALLPNQSWSAFDVPHDRVHLGRARLFVVTIWNFHSSLDERGHRAPTERAICRDVHDGTLWYRVAKPPPGAKAKTWVEHWKGLQIAIDMALPIIGVLTDVHTSRCALEHRFDCGPPRYARSDGAMWLQLRPEGEVGCEVRPIDIRQITDDLLPDGTLIQWNEKFDQAVSEAAQRLSVERAARLKAAPNLPRKEEVTTTVFDRNPDVVAEVLSQAKGQCQSCNQPAPFNRKSDGSPYLEVHHRVPLASGGEDTVANAIALCPNCHREAHYA